MFWLRIAIYACFAIVGIWIYNIFPAIFPTQVTVGNFPPVVIGTGTPIGEPRRLVIPRLGIDTSIIPVALTQSGNLDVPHSLTKVGWYKDGSRPGEMGSAVIDGHEVDEFGLGVIFKNLHLLQTGDKIYIETTDNQELEFSVNKKEVYPYDDAPLGEIFGATTSRNLNLITCNGMFDFASKTKKERLVVFASMRE